MYIVLFEAARLSEMAWVSMCRCVGAAVGGSVEATDDHTIAELTPPRWQTRPDQTPRKAAVKLITERIGVERASGYLKVARCFFGCQVNNGDG